MKTYRKLRRWHRMFGVTASLFVIFLAVTGLALNHTERLELDQKFIGSSSLLDWYNISLPEDLISFATDKHRISLLGGRLFFDELELEDRADQVLGVVEVDNVTVVATPGEILLLDQPGELIEKLTDADGVPDGMRRIGLSSEKQLVVQGEHGSYLVDIDALQWQEIPASKNLEDTSWSQSSSIIEPLKTSLAKAYRGKGLSVERILLDLHSGRIFGNFGVILIDAAALLFIILAVTGVWMWSRVRR